MLSITSFIKNLEVSLDYGVAEIGDTSVFITRERGTFSNKTYYTWPKNKYGLTISSGNVWGYFQALSPCEYSGVLEIHKNLVFFYRNPTPINLNKELQGVLRPNSFVKRALHYIHNTPGHIKIQKTVLVGLDMIKVFGSLGAIPLVIDLSTVELPIVTLDHENSPTSAKLTTKELFELHLGGLRG